MSKKGKVIRKGKNFEITECPPDHPIYKRGWIISGTYSKYPSKNNRFKSRYPEIQGFLDTQLPKEVRDQMSGEYPATKNEKSYVSSSTPKKK